MQIAEVAPSHDDKPGHDAEMAQHGEGPRGPQPGSRSASYQRRPGFSGKRRSALWKTSPPITLSS